MVNVNCPVVGAIAATGTADLEVLQTGSYTILGTADARFKAEVHATDFSNGFLMLTYNPNDEQDYTVELSESVVAKTLLKAALKAAVVDTHDASPNDTYPFGDAPNNKIEHYVKNWVGVHLKEKLLTDEVAAFLSAEEITNFELTAFEAALDTTVDNLWNSLNTTDTPLRQIVEQFSDADWRRTENGDSTDPSILPILIGDTMTFRFDLSAAITVSLVPSTGANAGVLDDRATSSTPKQNAYSMPANKQIDLVITFGTKTEDLGDGGGSGDVPKPI